MIMKKMLFILLLFLSFGLVYAAEGDVSFNKIDIQREGIGEIISYDTYKGMEVYLYNTKASQHIAAFKGEQKLFDIEADGEYYDVIMYSDFVLALGVNAIASNGNIGSSTSVIQSNYLYGYTKYGLDGEVIYRSEDYEAGENEEVNELFDITRIEDNQNSCYFLYRFGPDMNYEDKNRSLYDITSCKEQFGSTDELSIDKNIGKIDYPLIDSLAYFDNYYAFVSNNGPLAEDIVSYKLTLFKGEEEVFSDELFTLDLTKEENILINGVTILDDYVVVSTYDSDKGVVLYLYSQVDGKLIKKYETGIVNKMYEAGSSLHTIDTVRGYGNKFVLILKNVFYGYEIEKEEAVVDSAYKFLEGEGQTYKKGDLVFKTDAPLSVFSSVTVNGKELTKDKDYILTEGSTIVTLKESYIKTLKNGEYEISINYTNGTSTVTKFKIVTNPNTIDNILFVITAGLISLVGIMYINYSRRNIYNR